MYTINKSLARLQVAQKSAARLVAGVCGGEHTPPTLHALHWLSVQDRITYKVMLTTDKVIYTPSPPVYLKYLLLSHSPTRTLRSGDQALLQVQTIHRKVGERTYHYNAPKIWNSLNPALREASSVGIFK